MPSASEIGNHDPVLILRILAGSNAGLDKEIDDDQAELFGATAGDSQARPSVGTP
jgi:hypothetical protein